ncbi:hypothetical protein HAX54_043472, partial [Datura stramonium]|nr:hypothetical protein [Datura stramonium]
YDRRVRRSILRVQETTHPGREGQRGEHEEHIINGRERRGAGGGAWPPVPHRIVFPGASCPGLANGGHTAHSTLPPSYI